MGICYNLILEDEWDWDLGKGKEERLKEFEEKWPGYIERKAEWNHFVVYNIEKSVPYTDERKDLIKEYADRAYYTTDLTSGITELELPWATNSQIAYQNEMDNRRTQEQKKDSEEQCRLKLKGWKFD